jgi:hypothetical protein
MYTLFVELWLKHDVPPVHVTINLLFVDKYTRYPLVPLYFDAIVLTACQCVLTVGLIQNIIVKFDVKLLTASKFDRHQ